LARISDTAAIYSPNTDAHRASLPDLKSKLKRLKRPRVG